MKIIEYHHIFAPDNLGFIEKTIIEDGIIVYPTDTIYGLGGLYLSENVCQKIDVMKGRMDRPYSAAVSGLDMLRALVAEIPEILLEHFREILPGKLTVLLKASPKINSKILKKSKKIGIRVPAVPGILKLIDEIHKPIVSTSVNITGSPPLNDPTAIIREFPQIDILIDDGPLPPSLGSTIIDLTVTPPQVIRKGDDWKRILKVLTGV